MCDLLNYDKLIKSFLSNQMFSILCILVLENYQMSSTVPAHQQPVSTVVMGLRSRSVGGPKSQTEKTEDLLTARHLRCHKQAGAGHRHGHCQQQSADSEYHSFASVPANYEFSFQSALVLH